ncbi:hypothetical protein M513_05799, partial [Trichuris suis]
MRLGLGGMAWCCYKRSCRTGVSIRTGTWFENGCENFFFWSRGYRSMKFCEDELGMNKSVTARWNRHLRQVVAEALGEAPVQLGGPWRTVELDESLFSWSKYNRGKRIALMNAKSGKPRSIGEDLILPATAEILETVLYQPALTIISEIPLSRHTVQRRIDAMAQDIEATLCGILKNTEFALQLDESTLPGNEAVLLAYVRFIKQERLAQELLFAKELLTDTK